MQRRVLVVVWALGSSCKAASDANTPALDAAADLVVVDDRGAVTPDAGEADVADAASATDVASDADDTPDDVPPGALTYLHDIHPMFEAAGCSTFACHGTPLTAAGLLAYMPDARTAWRDMINRTSVREARVIVAPGDADESVLVRHAEETHVSAGVLTAEQAMTVRRWVAEGAYFARRGDGADAGADAGDADAGEPVTCSLAGARAMPMLPGACLPRCTRETWDQIVACRSEADVVACQTRAIEADPTAALSLDGLDNPLSLDCNTCLTWSTNSCVVRFCEAEFLAAQRCRGFRAGDPCEAPQRALEACIAGAAEFRACQRARDRLCAAP